jgi:Mrp family chromosome partitioning ATPase
VQGELASDAGAKALDELCSRGPFTLIDAPPLLGHSYAQPLLTRADGVVMVVRARSTRLAPAEATVKMLEESGVSLLGSVLNRFKSDMPFGIGEKY